MMKCDDCDKKIDKAIVERAQFGIATYFNCKRCFNKKHLNENGIRESPIKILGLFIN